jgi:hypothetical protein
LKWGQNANAVRRQVWTGLLSYMLLRYLISLSRRAYSFTLNRSGHAFLPLPTASMGGEGKEKDKGGID